MQEWMTLELSAADKDFVIGTPDNAIVRPKTKNLIEAAEKSFKTTFALRLLAGLACGETVFPQLPVGRPRRVLYLHGELSNGEIKDRTLPVVRSLVSQPSPNFWQGRVLEVHLIQEDGQKELRHLIETYNPEDVALDPWQAFIVGAEENSYSEMSKATQFCNQLIEDYGITLWIPIHLGKDRSKGARRHSVIAGWRDTRIQLRRDSGTLNITVDPRWGTPPDPFALRFRNGTLWSDGEPEFSEQLNRIREFLKSRGGIATPEELREYLNLPTPDAFRKALARAAEKGAIEKGPDYVALPIEPTPDKNHSTS